MSNTENLFIKIAEKIKNERTLRGWSQEKLAQKANISLLTIGTIERLTNKPSVMTLAQIADALDMKLCDLLNFD
ncbi:TPA: helix-turn-helix transcriptional regulator [Candidatus Scatousia excrementigallinarum]|uniref:Helix-turn-helix transcriptional regulator n=1 Tax=Candidatus Scatousia excrementigallinarum TaxID=2840935 RepID=A0A9D1F0Z7_9BACT|nr:helix-turn-helix transcriptional regulator [Candidatus Scatousia excrementigallinarum]